MTFRSSSPFFDGCLIRESTPAMHDPPRSGSVAGGDRIPPAAFDEGVQVITGNANRVENPNVPQFALVAELVDRRGAETERSRDVPDDE
jgi:hypothetical protein